MGPHGRKLKTLNIFSNFLFTYTITKQAPSVVLHAKMAQVCWVAPSIEFLCFQLTTILPSRDVLITSCCFHSLRLDGIEQSSANAVETEFILPYRASSFQFHKYKILMDIFLPSQDLIHIDDILPVGEKCLLHRMLSSAVRQWERGDENLVCPLSAQLSQSSINMQTQSTGRWVCKQMSRNIITSRNICSFVCDVTCLPNFT